MLLRLYISSTFSDLKEYREAAMKAIRRLNPGHTILAMEDYTANCQRPVEKCIKDVSSCDVYIGIFAWKYGQLIEEFGQSISEIEYRTAVKHNIQRLIFLLNEETPWPPVLMDWGPNADRIRKFREELKKEHIVDFFRSPDHLAVQISTAIPQLQFSSSHPIKNRNISNAVMEIYLDLLISKYAKLDLQGIYEAGQLRSINLEKVYVALKAEEETVYERLQMRSLLDIEVKERLGVEDLQHVSKEELINADSQLVREFYRSTPKSEKKNGYSDKDKGSLKSLGEVFRNDRYSVILGTPGSGKSTLARWLTLKLARAMKQHLQVNAQEDIHRVIVPLNQVDPDSDNVNFLDIGPTRLPCLVRISDYARALADSLNHSLSLAKYLGQHLQFDPVFLPDGTKISTDNFNELILHHLSNGNAVIILDGLDEIQQERREIVGQIEEFIKVWINGHGQHTEFKFNTFNYGKPCETGGNQILITSRPVGYHSAPIQSNLAHFSIQPMEQNSVKHFCNAWTEALYEVLAPEGTPLEIIQLNAQHEADALIKAIYNDQSPHLRDLATNPLLITIIATVFHYNQGKLPEQRAELYDRAIENLLKIWLDRPDCRAGGLQYQEVFEALVQIAAEIHSNQANGLIHISDLQEVFSETLSNRRGVAKDHPLFQDTVKGFLNTVRLNIGILAEESQHNYKFIHRTFQEYLAARHLLIEKHRAGERIIKKLDDPIWREPILLALSYIGFSENWSNKARTTLLKAFLDADDPLKHMIPRAALLIVSALTETKNIPQEIITNIVVQLLSLYSDHNRIKQFPSLQLQLNMALRRLHLSEHKELFHTILIKAIKGQFSETNITAAAIANLMHEEHIFTTNLVLALLFERNKEKSEWGFPIDKALRKAICSLNIEENACPWKATLDLQLISAYMPMRTALEKDATLLEHIKQSIEWMALIGALYGGYDNYDILTDLQQLFRWRIETILNNNENLNPLEEQKEIFIDKINKRSPEFKVENIYRESRLTHLILPALQQKQEAIALLYKFEKVLDEISDLQMKGEALIAIAVLGGNVLNYIKKMDVNENHIPLLAIVSKEMTRISISIQEAAIRSRDIITHSIPSSIPEPHRMDILLNTSELLMNIGSPALKISNIIPEYGGIHPNNLNGIEMEDAEYWSYLASGVSAEEDHIYNLAVVIDALGKDITKSEIHTIKTFSRVPYAKNNLCQYSIHWPLKKLPPRCDSLHEYFIQAIDAFSSFPAPTDFFGGFMLGRCKDLFPEFAAEAISVALCQTANFRAKFFYEFSQSKLQEIPELISDFLRSDLNNNLIYVKNPFVRFRIFFRLSMFSNFFSNYFEKAIQEFNKIQNPHDYVSAVEMILHNANFDFEQTLLEKALGRLPEITDIENRARATMRLIQFVDKERKDKMVSIAIRTAAEIENEDRKARTLREFRDFSEHFILLNNELISATDSIGDSWLRNHALGNLSGQIAIYLKQFNELTDYSNVTADRYKNKKEAWSAIWLMSLAKEIEFITNQNSGNQSIWEVALFEDYADIEQRLYQLPHPGTLKLSSQASHIIQLLLSSGKQNIIHLLLMSCTGCHPTLTTILENLLTNGNHILRPLAALLLGESVRVDQIIITEIIGLLESPTDKFRYRAALMIHSENPSLNNIKRKLVLSKVGKNVIEVIYTKKLELQSINPRITSIFNWTSHNTRFDKGEIIDQWITSNNHQDRQSIVIQNIIASIESASPEVIDVMIKYLVSSQKEIQKSILKALSKIAHGDLRQISIDQQNQILSSLQQIEKETLHEIKYLPNAPDTILTVIENIVKHQRSDNTDLLKLAKVELTTKFIHFDSFPEHSSSAMLEFMASFGASYYISVSDYWENAAFKAISIAENKAILKVLIEWVLDELKGGWDLEDSRNIISFLLTSLQVLTKASPIAFSVVADPGLLEPALIRVVKMHPDWIARMAAMQLLGYLRYVSEEIIYALQTCLSDLMYVHDAARESINNFRRTKGNIIDSLLIGLKNPSVNYIHATIEMLTIIGQMENTDTEDRKKILYTLSETIKQPIAKQPVYILKGEKKMEITYIEKLEESINRALLKIARLA